MSNATTPTPDIGLLLAKPLVPLYSVCIAFLGITLIFCLLDFAFSAQKSESIQVLLFWKSMGTVLGMQFLVSYMSFNFGLTPDQCYIMAMSMFVSYYLYRGSVTIYYIERYRQFSRDMGLDKPWLIKFMYAMVFVSCIGFGAVECSALTPFILPTNGFCFAAALPYAGVTWGLFIAVDIPMQILLMYLFASPISRVVDSDASRQNVRGRKRIKETLRKTKIACFIGATSAIAFDLMYMMVVYVFVDDIIASKSNVWFDLNDYLACFDATLTCLMLFYISASFPAFYWRVPQYVSHRLFEVPASNPYTAPAILVGPTIPGTTKAGPPKTTATSGQTAMAPNKVGGNPQPVEELAEV